MLWGSGECWGWSKALYPLRLYNVFPTLIQLQNLKISPPPRIIRKFKISCRWKFKVLYWKQDPQTSLSRTLQRFLQLRIHGKAAKMSPVLLWIYFKKTFSISIIFPRTKKSIPGAQNWSSNISAEQYFQKYFLNLVWLLWSALTEITSGLG